MSEKEQTIANYKAKMAKIDTTKVEGQNIYQYYSGMIKDLEKKTVVKLHVAEESSCQACE